MAGNIIRGLILGLIFVAMAGAVFYLKARNETLVIDRDAAYARAGEYSDTLDAYKNHFEIQGKELSLERSREALREKSLLETLELIGDIDATENKPLSDPAVSVIYSLYGAEPPAADRKP